jgi:hypothetical protein
MAAWEKTDLHPPHAGTPPLPSFTSLSQVPSCHLPGDPSLSASASPWHASCPPPLQIPLPSSPPTRPLSSRFRHPDARAAWVRSLASPLAPAPLPDEEGLCRCRRARAMEPPARPSGCPGRARKKEILLLFPRPRQVGQDSAAREERDRTGSMPTTFSVCRPRSVERTLGAAKLKL